MRIKQNNLTSLKAIQGLQSSMYNRVNGLNKTRGRLSSIPVSLIDGVLDIVKYPVSAIENLARAALNLVGAAFSKNYTVKEAFYHWEHSLINSISFPVAFFIAPFKVIYQFIVIARNPFTARPHFAASRGC